MARIAAVQPFQTEARYLYDDNTGMVFPSSEALEALIAAHLDRPVSDALHDLAGRFTDEDLREAAGFLEHWVSHYGAFYRDERHRQAAEATMAAVSPETVGESLASEGFRQLVLTLTEDCNLRCRYCCYSDAYPLTRERTPSEMPFDVGRRAIDYFLSAAAPGVRRTPWREVIICFYGGEPLLASPTLAELVEYARRQASGDVIFNITTNGTLLDDRAADFLVAHHFNILVSLDGDRDNHDRNRVFPHGRGSFDVVIENLRRFRARHPTYARIRLTGVVDWHSDFEALERFFSFDRGAVPELTQLLFVSPWNTHYYERFSGEEKAAFEARQRALERQYLSTRLAGGTAGIVATTLFEPSLVLLALRTRHGNRVHPLLPFTACCLPGQKIAVGVDGRFDICERVSGQRPIGNVDRGLDLNAVAEVIRDYNRAVCQQCWSCPVTRLCTLCFAACERGRGYAQSEANCAGVRRTTASRLSALYRIRERQPDLAPFVARYERGREPAPWANDSRE